MTQVANNYSAYSPYVFKTLHKVLHHSVSSVSLFMDMEVMAQILHCLMQS